MCSSAAPCAARRSPNRIIWTRSGSASSNNSSQSCHNSSSATTFTNCPCKPTAITACGRWCHSPGLSSRQTTASAATAAAGPATTATPKASSCTTTANSQTTIARAIMLMLAAVMVTLLTAGLTYPRGGRSCMLAIIIRPPWPHRHHRLLAASVTVCL